MVEAEVNSAENMIYMSLEVVERQALRADVL